MKIFQNIVVKQILTEKSKEALLKRYEGTKFQLQKECDQLQFELKKLERGKKYSSQKLTTHFEKEVNERIEKIKLVEFQLEQLHILPVGSELRDSEVQGMIDVEVGDNWEEKALSQTIVIEDGIIKEIR